MDLVHQVVRDKGVALSDIWWKSADLKAAVCITEASILHQSFRCVIISQPLLGNDVLKISDQVFFPLSCSASHTMLP